MITNLAKTCQVPSGCVNVKATTTEELGFTGRGEGISAHAVVLMESAEK
jgi:2-C-methyl-D-erythritol 2,4-cyclodiphosphate synthase